MVIILLLVLPNNNLQGHMTLNWNLMTNQLDHVVKSQQEIDLIKERGDQTVALLHKVQQDLL